MSITEKDKKYVWHPYTQAKVEMPPIPIVRGEGAWLIDERGKKYLDAISSWWVNIHGHAHPHICGKISEQAKRLEQVIFAGFTHPPAVQLAERLLSLLPGSYSKLFYSDNGSTAVEVALKMAFQFWYNQGKPKTKIIAFKNGYHGDTFGAMSASGRGVFTKPFFPFLFEVVHLEPPVRLISKEILRFARNNQTACFIFEPLVMGAGGMFMYEAEPLDEMISICRKHNILTIADEVMTGFGRTGKLFATEYLKNQPDIICLSKGLTGGFLPLGVTACSEKIFRRFYSNDRAKTFFHGHSYTANPLSCTAALASLDLVEKNDFRKNIRRINAQHLAFLKRIDAHPRVQNARVKGTILAFEFRASSGTRDAPEASGYLHPERNRLYDFFIQRGVLLRPLGNTIYVMPPYCIRKDELERVYEAIDELLHQG